MPAADRTTTGWTLGAALGAALLPKCPACLGAYLGVFGALGAGTLDRSILAWAWPLACGAVALALARVLSAARRQNRYGGLVVCGIGAGLLALGRMVWSPPVVWFGAALLVGGALNTRKRVHRRHETCPCPRAGR